MNHKTFGTLIAGAMAAMISQSSLSEEAKNAAPKAAAGADKVGELVKCYSESCSGKFEYKGQKNSCAGVGHAMEVPKEVCDSKKGLKVAAK